MSSNVIGIGNAASNPDNVLEQAKGELQTVVILGYDKTGHLDCRVSTNLTKEEILWIVEKFKHDLLMNLTGEIV